MAASRFPFEHSLKLQTIKQKYQQQEQEKEQAVPTAKELRNVLLMY